MLRKPRRVSQTLDYRAAFRGLGNPQAPPLDEVSTKIAYPESISMALQALNEAGMLAELDGMRKGTLGQVYLLM